MGQVNPWSAIPKRPPYILSADRPFVDHFNAYRATDKTRIWTNLLPEPYFGNPSAKVVLLLLNPGVSEQDVELHSERKFSDALRKCYAQGAGGRHFHLTSESGGEGRAWWLKACRGLLEHFDEATLADRLLAVEFSPYHSQSFGHGEYRLPSQEFGFGLVRNAMARGALIVGMRGQRLWHGAIPHLSTYKRSVVLNNPRSSSLGRGNLVKFDVLLRALRG